MCKVRTPLLSLCWCFVLCTAACLPYTRGTAEQGFIPRGIDVNREFARALADFYGPIPEQSAQSLQARVAATCDLRLAARGSHYGAVQFYQGQHSPREKRGEFCIWNANEQLIEFGQFDADGRLTGIHATFYKNRLRSLRNRPVASRPGLVVTRAWDWVLNNHEWKVTLAHVQLENLRPGRTVEYIFERESGYLVKRREYMQRGNQQVHRGIHYNGYPSKEHPQCVEFLDNGQRKIITDRCSFRDEIVPESNRF